MGMSENLGISGRVSRFFVASQLTPLVALVAMLLGVFAAVSQDPLLELAAARPDRSRRRFAVQARQPALIIQLLPGAERDRGHADDLGDVPAAQSAAQGLQGQQLHFQRRRR